MINENTAGERIIFTFERLGEDQQFFRILFVKPIAFSDQQVHSLSIPKDNLRPIRTGRSFEIKLCDQKENLEKDRTTKQNEESSTEEEDDFVVKEIIAFTVRQTFDYPDSFNIRFAEEIQYGKRKVIALSILKTPSGADYQQKLSIFKHDQRFQFLFPVGSMKIKENSNFSETFYLETTFNNLLEIKKLEKEAPAHFSGPSTSQKVRANKATNPTLANQKLAPDNNWFEFISKFKILELTQFMFAKETLDSNDPAARFSFPVLLSELTGFNDTLRGNPNHGYIKPLVGDLLQQLHQNNKVDLEKYLILQDEIKQPNT
ncbi:24994_t:CDS:2 [Racocetra persica]|uniref:24994_t:CDS:1 n=1 Tax=Racocetra persica TaxID=160502 RepID=A0ACA9QLV5_9GLOM|nr:24994_t:CDS:2 [Racocetra persica]